MRESTYTCDYCGRQALRDARGVPVVEGWCRVVALNDPNVGAGRDACAVCIARMDGWKGDTSGKG